MAWASKKEGDRVGVGPVTEQVVQSNDPHGGYGLVWERDMARVGVTYPPMKMEKSLPKRRHIKFRRRGITQKKAYNRAPYQNANTPIIVAILSI